MVGSKPGLTVEIGPTGGISAAAETVKWLGRHSQGSWRLVPQAGRMLVLNRTGGTDPGGKRQVELAGSFDRVGKLTAVFNLIHSNRRDGALHVKAGGFEAVLFFRRGVYLSGISNQSRHRLGEILVSKQMISASQRDACVAQVDTGNRLGALLVSRGWLTTPRVYDGLRYQAEAVFLSTCRLGSGEFHLIAPLDMTEVPAMLRLDVQHLLLDAIRQLDEVEEHHEADTHGEELRRTQPVAKEDLPDDGISLIITTYNEALRRLFATVGNAARGALLREAVRFIQDAAYAALFAGAVLRGDGTLPSNILLQNMAKIRKDDPSQVLQLALSELLFFLMFAAGDALQPEVELALQRDVADAMRRLPA